MHPFPSTALASNLPGLEVTNPTPSPLLEHSESILSCLRWMMVWGADFDRVLSAGGCFLVKPWRAQRSSVGLYIKFLGSVELLGCNHRLSKRLPPRRRRPRREQSWRQKTKTHQGLFKTTSSELRIMKALQLSLITAEGLDKNRVPVSWELSPFSKHYPSESSLDSSTACLLQDSLQSHSHCQF